MHLLTSNAVRQLARGGLYVLIAAAVRTHAWGCGARQSAPGARRATTRAPIGRSFVYVTLLYVVEMCSTAVIRLY